MRSVRLSIRLLLGRCSWAVLLLAASALTADAEEKSSPKKIARPNILRPKDHDLAYAKSLTASSILQESQEPDVDSEDLDLAPKPPAEWGSLLWDRSYRPATWVRAEALFWRTNGMQTPALVTTSPQSTPANQAGVLGQTGTEILFGNEPLNEDGRWGGRLQVGRWIDCEQTWAIEAEHLALEQADSRFLQSSNGDPILARPFFNALTDAEDSELIAYPSVVTGEIDINASSSFHSTGIRLRQNVFMQYCTAGSMNEYGPRGDSQNRIDFLMGYRTMRLDESLVFHEDLTLAGVNPTLLDVTDIFDTQTEFYGGEIGLQWQHQKPCWSFDAIAKIALGINRQEVFIDGSTSNTTLGVTQNFNGGLLAQRTNSGLHERDRFAVVPEIGFTLRRQLTSRWQLAVGYSFIYWNRVVRPGDQIDRVVNEELIPPEAGTITAPLRPRFSFMESNFLAHGLSLGLDYRW